MVAEIALAGHTLAENEAVIERGLKSFVEVGFALQEIRDARQYKAAGFDTFDGYCRERWGMSKTNADRTVAAAKVAELVTRARVTPDSPIPISVRSVEPLVQLRNQVGKLDPNTGELRDPEAGDRAVQEAWQEIVEKHDDPDRPITGPQVMRHLHPPAGRGTGVPGWLELIGTVGDKIKAAEKAMDRAEEAIGTRPITNPKLFAKADQYAEWAETLAERLRKLGG